MKKEEKTNAQHLIKFMLTFKLNINRQTFNNNIATAENFHFYVAQILIQTRNVFWCNDTHSKHLTNK